MICPASANCSVYSTIALASIWIHRLYDMCSGPNYSIIGLCGLKGSSKRVVVAPEKSEISKEREIFAIPRL